MPHHMVDNAGKALKRAIYIKFLASRCPVLVLLPGFQPPMAAARDSRSGPTSTVMMFRRRCAQGSLRSHPQSFTLRLAKFYTRYDAKLPLRLPASQCLIRTWNSCNLPPLRVRGLQARLPQSGQTRAHKHALMCSRPIYLFFALRQVSTEFLTFALICKIMHTVPRWLDSCVTSHKLRPPLPLSRSGHK